MRKFEKKSKERVVFQGHKERAVFQGYTEQ